VFPELGNETPKRVATFASRLTIGFLLMAVPHSLREECCLGC
jgi:hypothetical protein